MRRLLLSLIMLSILVVLPACGNSDGSLSQPTTAVVWLSTSGTLPSGTKIGGIDVTMSLPATVTVKSTPDSTNPQVEVTDPGVVVASGEASGSFVAGAYSAPTGTSPATVRIALVNSTGFGTGLFAAVNCDLVSGATVTAGDFSTGALSVVDLNGNALSGLTVGLTEGMQ